MFPFAPRPRPRHVLRLLALLAGFFGGTLRAKVTDYSTDPTLSVTTVNVGKQNLRPVSLAEIFTVIETETSLKLTYPPGTFSLGEQIVLENDGVISLAQLFGMVSAQKDLEFVRDGVEIAVRVAKAADGDRGRQAYAANLAAASVRPAPEPTLRVAAPTVAASRPAAGAGAAADGLAGAVSEIATDNQSRSRREKRIGAAVSASVTAATAGLEAKVDVLEVAAELVGAAVGAAPSFAETIANAAAFAAPIKGIKGAAARLRFAAFSAARSPKGAPATVRPLAAARPDSTPAAGRPEVIRVPAGQTPDSFFPGPAAEPAPSEPSPSAAAPNPTSGNLFSSRMESSSAVANSAPDPATSPGSLSFASESAAPTLGPINAAPIELPSAKPTAGADGVVVMEKFGVQGAVVQNSQVVLRQRATVSADVLTSKDFGKFIATDIADIVIRMPGLSTTSKGSFAVVRGLAERYNPVMLDGIVMPSSDPERQSPELDIFPSRLVDAIVISKAYEPSLPGTASGAGIDMRSKPIPEGRFAQIQFGLKADEGLFKGEDFLGSGSGGKWDLLGFGVKDRPSQRPATRPEMLAYVRSASTVNGVRNEKFPLGGRFSFTYENRHVFNEQRGRALGYGISFGYDRTASSEEGEKSTVSGIFSGSAATAKTDAAATGKVSSGLLGFTAKDYAESELEHRFGLLGSVGFAFNARNTVSLSAFWSQIGIDQHAFSENGLDMLGTFADFLKARDAVRAPAPFTFSPSSGVVSKTGGGSMEIYYRQRSLINTSLKGDHKLGESDRAKLTWTLARIGARQQEPEYLIFPFTYINGNPPNGFSAGFGSGGDIYTRYWRDTKEASSVGRIDADFKFDLGSMEDTQLRIGAYGDRTKRDYLEGAFALNGGGVSGPTLGGLVKALETYDRDVLPFDPSNAPPFAKGDRALDAGHLAITLPLAKERSWARKLDLLVGLRLESYKLNSVGNGRVFNEASAGFYGQLANLQKQPVPSPNAEFLAAIKENKTLPAAAVSYSPSKPLTFRFSYSKTTARPSFREIGSYFTIDRISDEYVHGNYQLVTSDVSNLDFRAEYFFPRSKDLVAVSLFKKTIQRPIERFSFQNNNLGSVSTFANNRNDVDLRGLEFEASKSLNFLGEIGSYFSVGGNFTYLDAEVARDQVFEARQIASIGIADTRPLYDQPKWILNSYLSFDHRPSGFSTTLSWFGISDVLQKVNEFTWDTYIASYGRLDLTLGQRFGRNWQVRLAAKNLTDPDRELIADPENTTERFVFRRYSDGRDYSVTATYDF